MLNRYANFVHCTLLLAGLGFLLQPPLASVARTADSVYAQSGDVTANTAVVWGRCNSQTDSYLIADVSTSAQFENVFEFQDKEDLSKKVGPLVKVVSEETDYTGSMKVSGLKPNTTYYYRLRCVARPAQDASDASMSPTGSFDTAPAPHRERAVSFVWAADLAGQGWGRNPDLKIKTVDGETIRGGYVIFEVMRKFDPDFAIFQGDMIYADGPIPAEKDIPADVGGGTWMNVPDKDYTAITLDEFRENWKYNLGDDKFAQFLLGTPVYSQWDDHEVTNNWYPGEILAADPYNGINADVLAVRAKQALREYTTIDGDRIYRKVQQGKHIELFLLDERSFRGANPDNSREDGLEMLGQEQFKWLKRGLKESTATWKIISTHDPLSIVTGGPGDRDSWGQGLPEVLGREVQLSQLLKFIKDEGIQNVVYLTSDVHFTAAVHYDPAQAVFTDFEPFYEFVIGPVHAGAFGPGSLDASFGSSYDYLRGPGNQDPPLPGNQPPPHLQSFGYAKVNESGRLTVQLVDITGDVLFKKVLEPVE